MSNIASHSYWMFRGLAGANRALYEKKRLELEWALKHRLDVEPSGSLHQDLHALGRKNPLALASLHRALTELTSVTVN